ncbi:MAG: VOC family protein [Chloroflexi bacterium]|nr:VOC family protein [Chloroflexota bacterium]
MLHGIDHIAVVVPDLNTAIANYTTLGFTVVPGGRHPIGSHNALIAFEDGSYIELLAFFEPNPGHRWYQVLQQGGGLVDYCMVTDNLAADLAAFRAHGLPLADPAPLSRTRPDGYKLDWVMGFSEQEDQQGILPFLIEDLTPRGERVPKQTEHANGVTGIQSITVIGPDAIFQPLTKLFESVVTFASPELNTSGYQATSGAHTFNFLLPPAAGAIADWVRQRGSGIYSAELTTTRRALRGDLNLHLALNGRFRLEESA